MPKKVRPSIEARSTSKRAASKEALKQMQRMCKIKDDDDQPETLEIVSDEEVIESPSKKKYKVCNKKSTDGNERNVLVLKSLPSDPTLNLQIWQEPLSETQADSYYKRQMEYLEMNEKIDNLLKQNGAEIIFEGDSYSAFETENVGPTLNSSSSQPSVTASPIPAIAKNAIKVPAIENATTTAGIISTMPTPCPGYSYVVDPKTGIVVGSVTPAGQLTVKTTKKRPRAVTPTPSPQASKKSSNPDGPPPLVSLRGNEPKGKKSLSVVDLTSDDKPSADSKEVSFNKLQGKTFPSLVVVARPNLKTASGNTVSDRAKLDAKVKSLLLLSATKFTEWLIQQGLVRVEQTCALHPHNKLKLGMYSDVVKFPFSGGYIWIAECCPQRFVSVFNGSLFEGAPHPPSILLKLMYHWACQTNVQNVVQWVKVENLYVKGLNTWLRSVCSVALHTHVKQLGGHGVKVEIGVISLGTTSQDGFQRQVKVEVLGILESETNRIRLRAVEPSVDRNFKKRFTHILEPLSPWVHPDSILVTDLTVDKNTLHAMGFLNVHQTNKNGGNTKIMDYLRRIVPRMFQNTLSLLSRQIIQQFLDELVWREWYGQTAADAFDNILVHLAEQTKADTGQTLTLRLNKVAANPFKNWSIHNQIASTNKVTSMDMIKKQRRKQQLPRDMSSQDLIKSNQTLPDEQVNLESYYYGMTDSRHDLVPVIITLKCHVCKETFGNNLKLMKHYFKHAHAISTGFQCHYCLCGLPSREGLELHIKMKHRCESRIGNDYMCVICDTVFFTHALLGKHMATEHLPLEMPYVCGSCTFRCSNHKQAIDHFYEVHNNHGVVQCPFCLRATTIITSQGRSLPHNLQIFLQHLQKHQRKTSAKKCHRCSLWFVQKDGVREHQKLHESQKKNKAKVSAWPFGNNGIMVPKSCKDFDDLHVDIGKVKIECTSDMKCLECKEPLIAHSHFKNSLECENANCHFSTFCKSAYTKHKTECKKLLNRIENTKLPFKMHCICGYSETNGSVMAKHLAVCEKRSCYPSVEVATSATVTHSMLDVLGLVRKSDDQPPELPDQRTELTDQRTEVNEQPPELNDKTPELSDQPEPMEVVSESEAEVNKTDKTIDETPDDSRCKECNESLKSHSLEAINCNSCKYVTCCSNAMEKHSKECPKEEIPPLNLPKEMHCECGFKCTDGNLLAKHLTLCEKKSAFSSNDDKPVSPKEPVQKNEEEDKEQTNKAENKDQMPETSVIDELELNTNNVNNTESLDELLTKAQNDILNEPKKMDTTDNANAELESVDGFLSEL